MHCQVSKELVTYSVLVVVCLVFVLFNKSDDYNVFFVFFGITIIRVIFSCSTIEI